MDHWTSWIFGKSWRDEPHSPKIPGCRFKFVCGHMYVENWTVPLQGWMEQQTSQRFDYKLLWNMLWIVLVIICRCIPAAICAANSGFFKTHRIFQHGAADLWRIECSNDGKPSWCGCAKWFHHFERWELSNKDPTATNQVFPNFRYSGGSPGLKFQVWKVCCDGWHGSLERSWSVSVVYHINERWV